MFRRILQLLVYPVVVMATAIPVSFAGERVALIVGNNEYENLSPLHNPGSDAARMAVMLGQHGFEVMSCDGRRAGCFDLARSELRDALENFEDLADGADVALLFYAGHGLQTAEGNVLAPVDMEVSCENWKAKREVLLDDVLNAMAGAGEKIVILDACRNDPLKAQQCLARGARPLSFGTFAVPDSVSRFLLITSTLNGQLAQDGLPGEHSPFAEALFHWMDAEPDIQFQQLFNHVVQRVVARTTEANFPQVPEILIRGAAPNACLSPDLCGSDPEAATLRREIAELTQKNLRSQELAEIGLAYLRALGMDAEKKLSDHDRGQILREITVAGKALAARNDEKGEDALAALRNGSEAEAVKLFEETIVEEVFGKANLQRSPEKREEAFEAARHIAALFRPKDVVKAAEHFQTALAINPDHYQTWMDLASVSVDTGNTAQALDAYQKASAIARESGSLQDRYWAETGQGDILLAQGRLELALSFYEAAGKSASELTAQEPLDADARRNVSVSLNRIGDVYMMLGELMRAREAFTEGFLIAEGLAAKEPDHAGWKQDLAVSNEKLGNVLRAQGDLEGALSQYQAGLERIQAIAEANHENIDLQRRLMTLLNKIGEVKLAQSAAESALEVFSEAGKLAQRLVDLDRGNASWQRDLAVSDERTGDVLAYQGKPDLALEYYRNTLDRVLPLISADPANLTLNRMQSIAINKIGVVQLQLGEEAEALTSFKKSRQIILDLIKMDPSNQEWRADLAINYERMADTLSRLGRKEEALELYRRNLEYSRELAEADPSNVERQWGLYVALWRVAENTDERIKYFQEALLLLENLHAEDRLSAPRVEWLELTRKRLAHEKSQMIGIGGLSDRYWQILGEGDLFVAQGRLDQALERYGEARSLAAGMVARHPEDPEAERNLSVSLNRAGDTLVAMGELDAAQEAFKEGLSIAGRLAARFPGVEEWERDVAFGTQKLGDVLKIRGDLDGALSRFEENLQRLRPAYLRKPEDSDTQRFVMTTLIRIGEVRLLNLDQEGALQAYREAMGIAERFVALDPGNARWQRDLAIGDERVGDVLVLQGEGEAAMVHYQASFERIRKLRQADQENTELKRLHAVILNKIGDIHLARGAADIALESFEESRQIVEVLTSTDPSNLIWQSDLTVSYERVADSYLKLSRFDEALEIYRRNLDLTGKLAGADPDNFERQWGLYVALWRMAEMTDEKSEFFNKALGLLLELQSEGRLPPDRHEWIAITRERLEAALVAGK